MNAVINIKSPFCTHDVFTPMQACAEVPHAVRVVDVQGLDKVFVIDVARESHAIPYPIPYDRWVQLIDDGVVERCLDPYIHLTSAPTGLTPAAAQRLGTVIATTASLGAKPDLLHRPSTLYREIAAIAARLDVDKRTVKNWILLWLKAGRNAAAVVEKLIDRKFGTGKQATGAKRGARSVTPALTSDAPAHEIADKIAKAYDNYIKRRKMTWDDAYYEMLIALCKIPAEAVPKDDKGEALLSPALIQKFRIPSKYQFRYRCRQLKRAEEGQGDELPRGKRGKATDNVWGPGFFEIDATHFQIQLVSRITKAQLVSRPTVYLIVDIFSGAIAGYALTLENPSWAVAALALHNAFSDKGPVFERLGLPYTSEDWPCRHLPNMLRADRAELVSNQGQEFPASGIRVEITPSMTPIAKGTVEGKNAEMKETPKGRFNLPGLFPKYRRRREPDGKKGAALDLLEFERILVEIIMDLNRKAVRPHRIPTDALKDGSRVASRVGMYEWGIDHRPGFTREMPENFAYEHLLTSGDAKVTPGGILFDGEVFNCDALRDLGYLTAALNGSYPIKIAHNPLLAAEIFFRDPKSNRWLRAANLDPEIHRTNASFEEARERRAMRKRVAEQAKLNHRAHRRERAPAVNQIVKDAVKAKNELPPAPSGSKHQVRANRAKEKAGLRSPGLNGTLPEAPIATGVPAGASLSDGNAEYAAPAASSASKVKSLWSRVDAVSK